MKNFQLTRGFLRPAAQSHESQVTWTWLVSQISETIQHATADKKDQHQENENNIWNNFASQLKVMSLSKKTYDIFLVINYDD